MKIKTKYDETVVNNYLDSVTGELIETHVDVKTHKIVLDSKDQFAFMYSTLIGSLQGLNGSDVKLLMYCTLNCTYNTNVVALNSHFLKLASQQTGVSLGSLKNSLTVLHRKNILIKLGGATYRVNPKYFWRGESAERVATMRFVLEVECPTC